jgi:hypothetical protein
VKRLALSHDDAVEIRALCETHAQVDVAALFQIHPATVSRVRRGLSWTARTVRRRYPNAKLSTDDVREIRRSTKSLPTLALRYGVCRRTIYRVIRGESWSAVG